MRYLTKHKGKPSTIINLVDDKDLRGKVSQILGYTPDNIYSFEDIIMESLSAQFELLVQGMQEQLMEDYSLEISDEGEGFLEEQKTPLYNIINENIKLWS